MSNQPNSISGLEKQETGLLSVGTTVLWGVCLTVGVIGLKMPRGELPVVEPAPMDAELLNVEAINQRVTAEGNPPSAPAPPAAFSAPPVEPLVAAPSPAIAFAEAVNAPVHSVVVSRDVATQPSVIQLTFGEGEGEQPPPEYPDEARFAGQEGTVVVRLMVGADGRVTDATASSSCPWPLLNSAAVRAVRSSWRFRKGPVRTYEVSIQFQLNRHE
ncbi:MAG TPA: energy transducer TonB [Tepidisphaeraceae bacterium]